MTVEISLNGEAPIQQFIRDPSDPSAVGGARNHASNNVYTSPLLLDTPHQSISIKVVELNGGHNFSLISYAYIPSFATMGEKPALAFPAAKTSSKLGIIMGSIISSFVAVTSLYLLFRIRRWRREKRIVQQQLTGLSSPYPTSPGLTITS